MIKEDKDPKVIKDYARYKEALTDSPKSSSEKDEAINYIEENYRVDDFKQLGKDTFQEMGEISDTWTLSWKISEPIIESVFKQSASMSQEK